MAVGANSYGSVAQVASLTRRWTNAGVYDAGTTPTITEVESWIDGVSGMMNVVLRGAGFAIPITQADAKTAIAQIVVGLVADLCNAARSTGRFYSEKAMQRGSYSIIRADIDAWVEANADGLELLGATRNRSQTAGILYRDTDESGNETFPIFQRSGFGNTFTDWDKRA